MGNLFYVADSDAVVSFHYVEGETRVSRPPTKVVDLPAGPINHHWTKNLLASHDGSRLYATVGSNSNVHEFTRGPVPPLSWNIGSGGIL